MKSLEGRQWVSASGDCAAATNVQIMLASPGAGKCLYITYCNAIVYTADPASIIDIRSSDSAVLLGRIGATAPVGTEYVHGPTFFGIKLPVNTGLVIDPSPIGAALTWSCEAYVEISAN